VRSIVIAYEDDYHEELHLLVKAMRRDLGLPEMIVEGRPVRGTGNTASRRRVWTGYSRRFGRRAVALAAVCS
jgi:hypothetical protein